MLSVGWSNHYMLTPWITLRSRGNIRCIMSQALQNGWNLNNNCVSKCTILFKLVLYTQWAAMCFGQPCGHLQEHKMQRLLYYLLTQWSRVLLEKLTGCQLVKKFPAFYGTRRFINPFTRAHHLSLSWASSIQFIPPHPNSWCSFK